MTVRLWVTIGALFILSTPMAAAAPATTQYGTRLYDGPGYRFDVIRTIPGGQDVDVIGCSRGWCDVLWYDYEGFVREGSLDFYDREPPFIEFPPLVFEYGFRYWRNRYPDEWRSWRYRYQPQAPRYPRAPEPRRIEPQRPMGSPPPVVVPAPTVPRSAPPVYVTPDRGGSSGPTPRRTRPDGVPDLPTAPSSPVPLPGPAGPLPPR